MINIQNYIESNNIDELESGEIYHPSGKFIYIIGRTKSGFNLHFLTENDDPVITPYNSLNEVYHMITNLENHAKNNNINGYSSKNVPGPSMSNNDGTINFASKALDLLRDQIQHNKNTDTVLFELIKNQTDLTKSVIKSQEAQTKAFADMNDRMIESNELQQRNYANMITRIEERHRDLMLTQTEQNNRMFENQQNNAIRMQNQSDNMVKQMIQYGKGMMEYMKESDATNHAALKSQQEFQRGIMDSNAANTAAYQKTMERMIEAQGHTQAQVLNGIKAMNTENRQAVKDANVGIVRKVFRSLF